MSEFLFSDLPLMITVAGGTFVTLSIIFGFPNGKGKK